MTQRDHAAVVHSDVGVPPNARVVVIDDEEPNVALLARVLRAAGVAQVVTVTDARQAVDRCLDLHADLVVLDLHMPDMDGFAVMAELQARLPLETFMPVIAVTADVTAETRRQALAAGAHDFLTKPLDTVEVELRARNLLRSAQLQASLQQERDALERRVDERTQQLAQANAELRTLGAMKREFIALISHEMRTPLTVINGFAELLGQQWDRLDSDQRTRHGAAVQRNAARLEGLIENLLQASVLTQDVAPGAPDVDDVAVSVDMHGLLVDIASDAGFYESQVTIECPPDLHTYMSRDILDSILSQLLSNARKYGHPPIHIRARADTTMLDIVVSDQGPGVPDTFSDQLFEQFTQASIGDRRTATGTGLGLWIARTLARAHGGDLCHEPEMPGAAFRLRLPHRLPANR